MDFEIIQNTTLEQEDLIIYNSNKIIEFIKRFDVYGVAIEGLSFMSKSSFRDLICGNFWNLRCSIRSYNENIFIGIIPVLTWRNRILSKEERKEVCKIKDGLKISVVNKLPLYVKDSFLKYIEKNNLPEKSIYDLSDAYFIAQHRIFMI